MVRKALELSSKNENQHLRASRISTPAGRSTGPRNLRGFLLKSADSAKPNYLATMVHVDGLGILWPMVEPNYGDIAAALGDPKSETRRLISGAMRASVYRDVHECPDVKELENNLASSVPPDLVVTDTKMPGSDIFSVTSKLRRGEIGGNPFVPVIMLT